MSSRFSSLSGFWTGVYDYPGPGDPVAFNAILTECAGALTGEIVEPNTFADPMLSELFASLAGDREGETVRFVKTYEGATGAEHLVRYEGVVDSALTKIEGAWSITEDGPFAWRGPFVMNRRDNGESAVLEADETVDAPSRR